MRVLVACEFSGRVRDAFARRGHDVWSCDLLPSETEGNHIQGNVLEILNDGWDLMVAHPPCTYLTVTGNKWMKDEFRQRWPERLRDRVKAIEFFIELWLAPIKRICIENPIGIMSSVLRSPDQVIQPYYFGDEARKATCLWLQGLPQLVHSQMETLFDTQTHVGQGEIMVLKNGGTMARWYGDAGKNGDDRAKIRSTTFPGIAEAMAEQWGELEKKE